LVGFEKEGYIMLAIAPKYYLLKSSNNDKDESVKKMKGVSFRLNDNIELENYKSCLEQSSVLILLSNPIFTHTPEYEKKKKVINGSALDKIIVLENYSYTPFLPNLTKEDYYFAKKTYYLFLYCLLLLLFFVIIITPACFIKH
jgi:hypothetical protein